MGEGVIIEGSDEAGDVLMDVSGDFTLQNITIQPAGAQVGIVHHNGTLTLQKAIFKGKFRFNCTSLNIMYFSGIILVVHCISGTAVCR